ncbi:MAG: hypothetical protein JJE30_19280 [Desulfuromonadales bacterium]|nr:hypothetical protein [Desulfuromonadales bacterium]
MKKVSSYFMAAALCAVFSLGAALPALSAVFTPGPQDLPSPPGNGFPKWYTDPANPSPPPLGGLSLVPCLSQTISPDLNAAGGLMCVLLPDVGFNPANPVVFTNNFPPEFFYYIADARILDLAGVQGDRANYRAALEGTFGNGIAVAGDQITFARVRFVVDAAVNGTYRITHPFGQRTFTGVVAGPAAIVVQEDIGIGAPGGPFLPITTPVGAASLAGGGLQQFLVKAVGGVPAPITVGNQLFIGDPNVDQFVVGATQLDPVTLQPFNSFMVERDTGAGFVQIGRTDNFALAGQIIALTLTPPAAGTNFGFWKLATPSTARTFALQNLSPAAVTLVISTGATPSPDFTIASSSCGAPLATGAVCTFDVIFNTATTGAKSATITITGGVDVPPVQTTVTGVGDGIAPIVTPGVGQAAKFTNAATTTISGTVADNPGGAGVASVQVSFNLGAFQPAILSGNTWLFTPLVLNENAVNTIAVTATDLAQVGGNTSAPPEAFSITHDNIRPDVSLTAPADALVINKPTLQALTFTATDLNLATTILTVNGTNVALLPTPPATLGPLTDGQKIITLTAIDSAGNTNTVTNTIIVALTNGDIDGNGTVTIADALQALRATVGLITITPNTAPFFHGDVAPLGSPNGAVDISDALLILRRVVGLETF